MDEYRFEDLETKLERWLNTEHLDDIVDRISPFRANPRLRRFGEGGFIRDHERGGFTMYSNHQNTIRILKKGVNYKVISADYENSSGKYLILRLEGLGSKVHVKKDQILLPVMEGMKIFLNDNNKIQVCF